MCKQQVAICFPKPINTPLKIQQNVAILLFPNVVEGNLEKAIVSQDLFVWISGISIGEKKIAAKFLDEGRYYIV